MREEATREYLEELYKLGYRYLVTNGNGNDGIYKTKPDKYSNSWADKDFTGRCLIFNLGLSSWDDTEPKSIAELLGVDEVDWYQVPIDAKILVSSDGIKWHKRYFAKYENGKIYAWDNGLTSWNAKGSYCWVHAKLVEE